MLEMMKSSLRITALTEKCRHSAVCRILERALGKWEHVVVAESPPESSDLPGDNLKGTDYANAARDDAKNS